MQESNLPPDLDWMHKATEISAAGLDRSRQASSAELVSLAQTLELVSIERLQVCYRIRSIKRDTFLLRGELSADVEQACGVTLDPVKMMVEAQFEVEFWPEDKMPKVAIVSVEDTDFDPFAADDPESLDAGKIAVGRIVFEHLANAIEPYPRLVDVALERDQAPVVPADGEALDTGNPFAVLVKLKNEEG